ncbi:type IV secretory system conjugative DNA transfer family protein [Candidatus Methylospira mobilis]|uniref:type IV secretory system conjugative DNA transfer family protein n=1 Tax=Candidatus Methylospira mobilis TaxID=1808979 RepID=UPI0028E2149C|nr:type IV secretory system conjugative DNA transfer family protein [Candidatus Methylospira mobilis]WNV05858.1 type IV secretory system conjugative DNA transfer family protein [Candidatus Methylospira mobilis]
MLVVSAELGAEEMPNELRELETLTSVTSSAEMSGGDAGNLRIEAIRETAQTLGMQSAVRWRYDQINESLEKDASHLDRLYDFHGLMMHEGRFLPPVITVAHGTETLNHDQESTASDTTYEIVEDARIVISPPSWRDYLPQHFDVNNDVNPMIRPKDVSEELVWKEGVRLGWQDGLRHADALFEINMNRLTRDFRGLIRFHLLAKQHVVDVPQFAVGDLGVTVNGRLLDVNQRIFQITEPVKFNGAEKWTMQP